MPLGNYALNGVTGSPAIDYIPATGTNAQPHPPTDFFGNPRPDPGNPNRFDVGAVEYQNAITIPILVVTPSPVLFGSVVVGTTPSPTQALTLRNDGGAAATGIAIGALASPFSRSTNCPGTLPAGAACTITVTFGPTAVVTYNASLTITTTTAGVTVNGAPVAISGTGIPAIRTATVTPVSLAFGSQSDGNTSAVRTVTVTNTGNIALTGGAFTFGGGTPQPFARAGLLQGGPGTCSGTLALGANCTINVVFTPPVVATQTTYSRTLAVAYTGAIVTGAPVTLTGMGTIDGTLSFTSATNGTLFTVFGVRVLTFTIPAPRAAVTSALTITNTGFAPLQITAETLALNTGGFYSISGTTCSFTTPLAVNGTCIVSIRYATPAARPLFPDIGLATFANNGSGTVGGLTGLGLMAQ